MLFPPVSSHAPGRVLPGEPGKEQRNKDSGHKSRKQHAAQHARAHRLARRCSCPGSNDQRHDPEHKSHRSHDDGAKAQARGFNCGLRDRHSFPHFLAGEFHDQNGVLGRQPYQRNQAYLEINIVGHAANQHRKQSPGEREGHGHDDGQRQRPGLKLRGQDQEHHDDCEGECEHGGRTGAFFLKGLGGPRNLVVIRQVPLRNFFHQLDRVTRAYARSAARPLLLRKAGHCTAPIARLRPRY